MKFDQNSESSFWPGTLINKNIFPKSSKQHQDHVIFLLPYLVISDRCRTHQRIRITEQSICRFDGNFIIRPNQKTVVRYLLTELFPESIVNIDALKMNFDSTTDEST